MRQLHYIGIVGVIKMGNIVQKLRIEPTSLAFRARVLRLHHIGSMVSSLYSRRPVCAAPFLRGQCRLLHIKLYMTIDGQKYSISTHHKPMCQIPHIHNYTFDGITCDSTFSHVSSRHNRTLPFIPLTWTWYGIWQHITAPEFNYVELSRSALWHTTSCDSTKSVNRP